VVLKKVFHLFGKVFLNNFGWLPETKKIAPCFIEIGSIF